MCRGYLAGGVPIATPVFDGATEEEMQGVAATGGARKPARDLYDGRTGDPSNDR